MALVAHGKDAEPLFFRLSRTHAWERPLIEHEATVWFNPTQVPDILPAVYAGQIGIPALRVDEPMVYWLTVATRDGPTTRLPLYIADRASWEEDHGAIRRRDH